MTTAILVINGLTIGISIVTLVLTFKTRKAMREE